jgi:hypothetical protein
MGAVLGLMLVILLELGVVACGPTAPRDDTQTEPPAVGPAESPEVLRLPKRPGSIRFAAIGDAGRGHGPQYQVAARMEAFRAVFPFTFVIMLGDNVYDGGRPEDYKSKFERPYKPLLDEHVKFYAVDTEYLDNTQLAWLERELGRSQARWKIPVFHRPIFGVVRAAVVLGKAGGGKQAGHLIDGNRGEMAGHLEARRLRNARLAEGAATVRQMTQRDRAGALVVPHRRRGPPRKVHFVRAKGGAEVRRSGEETAAERRFGHRQIENGPVRRGESNLRASPTHRASGQPRARR